MPRYVAFLRGVTPMNASMPALKRTFEAAGFTDVRTLLSSGNVVFTTRAAAGTTLERRAERAMQTQLGRTFGTIVRSADYLRTMLDGDPFAGFDLAPVAKRVVTFLRQADGVSVTLPIERDGARILKLAGSEAFTAYLPSEKGPVFMTLIERTFGTDVTTRTLDTVKKCAQA